jgi:two-component system cell cycle sensor histidine kinase/response regulator CckA
LNMNAVILDLEKMLRRLLTDEVNLDLQLAENLPLLTVDPAHLEQVIINLVINARDAMPNGGRIRIASSRVDVTNSDGQEDGAAPGTYVALIISDTGVGMEEHIKAHIFEPFFTTKEKGKGTGLGLATVYGVVTQNNGLISVDSKPGHGTTFRILWPSNTQIGQAASLSESLKEKTKRGAESIFVVEDESIVRRSVSRVLRKSGYEVFEASSAQEAMDLWDKLPKQPVLLLTDVVMPGMNGRQLAEWASLRHPGLAVLYMSGYSNDIIAHNGKLDPGVNFIEKSFTQENLLSRVRDILDRIRGTDVVSSPTA